MKQLKKVLLMAVITLCAVSAEAKIISIGATAAMVGSSYSIEGVDNDDINNNTGWQAGVQAAVTLPFLSVTPELLYTSTSFEMGDSKVKVQSLDLPIVAGLTIVGPLKIEAGPQFSLYDKAKTGDVDYGRMRSEVGYVAGLKLTLLQKLIISARYNGQFGKHSNSFNSSNSYEVGYNAYTISVGFRL